MVTAARPPARAPSATLPLSYLAAATSAFLVAAAGVAWVAEGLAGHYYEPRVMALAHTVALGWMTLAILGASYQLIPVVLQRPLFSERLACWQLVALAAGIPGMIGHFYLGRWAGLPWAAALVGLGLGGHLVNVALTVRGLPRWSFTARLVAGAHVGLGLTLVFGVVLAVARAAGRALGEPLATVHAHVHLALLGWVAPMIVGVAARVFPMFLLAPEPGGRLGDLQLVGLAIGVPAVVGGLLAVPGLVLPGAVAVAVALAAHVVWVAAIVRRRRRPALDWGLGFVLTGTSFLPITIGVGLALAAGRLAGPRPALAYAVLGVGGWASLTIAGMLLKIVPFLVWQRTYASRVGRAPVPTLAQLSWPAAEAAAYFLLAGGVAALAVATAAGSGPGIRAAGLALTAGAGGLVLALAHAFTHLASTVATRGTADAAPARSA